MTCITCPLQHTATHCNTLQHTATRCICNMTCITCTSRDMCVMTHTRVVSCIHHITCHMIWHMSCITCALTCTTRDMCDMTHTYNRRRQSGDTTSLCLHTREERGEGTTRVQGGGLCHYLPIQFTNTQFINTQLTNTQLVYQHTT